MEEVSPSALLMGFFFNVKGHLAGSKRKPNPSNIQGALDGKDSRVRERQHALKIPYSQDWFLKELTYWFSGSSKTW